MTSEEFATELAQHLRIKGRRIRFKLYPDSVYVNFYNLPEGVGQDGAEAENNRMMFQVLGFQRAEGRVTVKLSVSALPREYKFRGKTASPDVIAKYIASFLNKVAAEVEPRFTHTKF